MLFSSLTFLYYFLPLTLIFYLIVPKHMKNGTLLIASLIFYAWGEPKYVLLMMVSIIVGYIAGRLIETFYDKRYSKYILAAAILIHLGCFVYFKYTDFILENMNRWIGTEFSMIKIALPIGISFYAFQILSYEIDVYRGKIQSQKNIIRLATYIAMFPQLIAGPIVRYSDIEEQLGERDGISLACLTGKALNGIDDVAYGFRRFILGLGKKVLIANTLGELCEVVKVSNDLSVLYLWLCAVAFTLHIYYDFSGYSDMAIGLGRIFGFRFMENFNYPYISKSVTEFWRRWHMSLSQWFRDYVYIPLGGNRCSKGRWLMNIGFVWFLTGLWHGAEWNFALWGLYFAVILILEKLWIGKWLEKHMIVGHVYTCLMIIVGFVLFNAANLSEAASFLGGMFGIGNYPIVSMEFNYYFKSFAVTLVIALIGATPIVSHVARKIEKHIGNKTVYIELVCLIAIMLLSTASLVDGSFNPFLYFRF